MLSIEITLNIYPKLLLLLGNLPVADVIVSNLRQLYVVVQTFRQLKTVCTALCNNVDALIILGKN